MEGKDVFKYTLNLIRSLKFRRKRSLNLSSKGEVTFVSDLLFQRLVILANVYNISFHDCKGHELFSIYPNPV